MTPWVAETRPEDWVYVSEGGASIVFSYQGTHHDQFSGHVLRLRKLAHHGSSDVSQNDTDAEQPDDIVAFQENIISTFVPSEFLPRLVVVLLNDGWLRSLVELRDGDRPPERRQADCIDVHRKKGVLATDLIGGTPVAIEIKPKWGFLPAECHLSPETVVMKTTTCRFCMHTGFRARQRDVCTTYCPLDLFSRDESRIRRALNALWTGWYESGGSLNNLRFFASGRMTKPNDDYSMKLLARFFVEDESTTVTNLQDAFVSVLTQALADSPVLPLLSTLQRKLDILDVEGLSKLYTRTTSDPLSSGLVPDPSIEEWEDFVKVYHSDYDSWDHASPNSEHLRHYLMAYLLSATFKDCSIIIRPRPQNPSGTRPGPAWLFDITIIDMGIKSMDRLGKWEKLDRTLVEHYKSSGSQRRCT